MIKNNENSKTVSPIVKAVGAMIHMFRDSANISIRELAKRSGLSPSTIWKIEQGTMAPTIVVIAQIAHGLGIKPTELMEPVPQEDFVIYLPAKVRSKQYSGKVAAESFSGHTKEWTIMANKYSLKKGASSGNKAMMHDDEEIAYCLKGKIQYTIDGNVYILNPTDSIHFKSKKPHSWKNIYNGNSEMLQIIVPKA